MSIRARASVRTAAVLGGSLLALALGICLFGAAPAGTSPSVTEAMRFVARTVPDPGSCARCHKFEPSLSHPVGVRSLPVVGGKLPLQEGRVTCLTCHDANESHAATGAPVGIRGDSAAALCLNCHEGMGPGGGASHASFGLRAHPSQKREDRVLAKHSMVDHESAACMSCHDGASAREAGSHPMRSMNGELMAEHPIGIPLRATERTKHGDFKIAREGSIDHRIRLFNGNLGCGSCHSVYSKQDHLLVMSNQKSRLCLSCHTQ